MTEREQVLEELERARGVEAELAFPPLDPVGDDWRDRWRAALERARATRERYERLLAEASA